MAAYSKTTVTPGDAATATFANAVQTQYDCVVTEAAAGHIPVHANALTNTISSARLPSRYASVFLSATGGTPTTTSGCAPAARLELTTNDIMLTTLDFDGTAIEYACWTFALPDGYIAGTTVDATFYWTAASGSGGVVWGISGRAIANDGALDQALGTAAEATDTLITANDVHVTSAATVTLAGSPAGGQIVVFKVYRDPTDGSDTMGTDAKLLGVKLEYATSYGD